MNDARKGHSVELTLARDMTDKKRKIRIYSKFKFASEWSRGFAIW